MSFDSCTTIERCPHDAENPYAQISRALIRDENASPLLRFVLIFLLSQKDGWKIKPGQLIKLMKPHGIGKDKVYGIFNEGIELGYIEKQSWLERGLKRTGFRISETPKFKKSLPRPAQPDADGPDAAQPSNKKEHRISKDILKKEKKNSPAAQTPEPMEFLKYPKITKMPMNSFAALVKEHGKDVVEEYLERLNDYADIDPGRFKKYANHATVLKNWIKRDARSSQGKGSSSHLMTLLNRVKEKNIPLIREGSIEIKDTSIAFRRGTYYKEISFEEKGALDRIRNEIIKAHAKI